jgi:hypothetical protein
MIFLVWVCQPYRSASGTAQEKRQGRYMHILRYNYNLNLSALVRNFVLGWLRNFANFREYIAKCREILYLFRKIPWRIQNFAKFRENLRNFAEISFCEILQPPYCGLWKLYALLIFLYKRYSCSYLPCVEDRSRKNLKIIWSTSVCRSWWAGVKAIPIHRICYAMWPKVGVQPTIPTYQI